MPINTNKTSYDFLSLPSKYMLALDTLKNSGKEKIGVSKEGYVVIYNGQTISAMSWEKDGARRLIQSMMSQRYDTWEPTVEDLKNALKHRVQVPIDTSLSMNDLLTKRPDEVIETLRSKNVRKEDSFLFDKKRKLIAYKKEHAQLLTLPQRKEACYFIRQITHSSISLKYSTIGDLIKALGKYYAESPPKISLSSLPEETEPETP